MTARALLPRTSCVPNAAHLVLHELDSLGRRGGGHGARHGACSAGGALQTQGRRSRRCSHGSQGVQHGGTTHPERATRGDACDGASNTRRRDAKICLQLRVHLGRVSSRLLWSGVCLRASSRVSQPTVTRWRAKACAQMERSASQLPSVPLGRHWAVSAQQQRHLARSSFSAAKCKCLPATASGLTAPDGTLTRLGGSRR